MAACLARQEHPADRNSRHRGRCLVGPVVIGPTATALGDIPRRPLAIHLPPEFARWVFVLEGCGETWLTDAVVASEHGEAGREAGMPTAVNPGWLVAGKGPPWFIAGLTATPVGILSLSRRPTTGRMWNATRS